MDREQVKRLAQRLRDTATGIEAGFVADPRGHRVGLIREAADALEQSWPPSREQIAEAIWSNTEVGSKKAQAIADAILAIKPEVPNV